MMERLYRWLVRLYFYLDVVDRVRTLPGVEQAAIAVGLPFGFRFTLPVRVPGLDETPTIDGSGPGVSPVSAEYFATVGTAILAGRPFTAADRAGSPPVVIVNELMARHVWPGESALGKRIGIGDGSCATIVGVAENTHRSRLRENPSMHVYLPHGQEVGFGGAVLLVRGGVRPLDHAAAVRRILADIDPTITFVDAQTIQQRIDPQLESWRLGSAVFLFSGVLALVVAAVGLYSVLAYLVAERRREIGIRIALGARTRQVAGLIYRRSLGLTTSGILIGLLLAAWAGSRVEPLLVRRAGGGSARLRLRFWHAAARRRHGGPDSGTPGESHRPGRDVAREVGSRPAHVG